MRTIQVPTVLKRVSAPNLERINKMTQPGESFDQVLSRLLAPRPQRRRSRPRRPGKAKSRR